MGSLDLWLRPVGPYITLPPLSSPLRTVSMSHWTSLRASGTTAGCAVSPSSSSSTSKTSLGSRSKRARSWKTTSQSSAHTLHLIVQVCMLWRRNGIACGFHRRTPFTIIFFLVVSAVREPGESLLFTRAKFFIRDQFVVSIFYYRGTFPLLGC